MSVIDNIVSINHDKCIGCTMCARNCPVGAIEGALKQKHTINTDKCVNCGYCEKKCPQHLKVRELLKKVDGVLKSL